MLATAEEVQRKQERLNSIYRRSTRYEVLVTSPDAVSRLVGYTIHYSRTGLLETARRIGDRLIRLTGISESDTCSFVHSGKLWRMNLGNGWTIQFTGRTERDAILGGEFPRIGA